MGAHTYYYFVKHNSDIAAALNELREREFNAGRYNPVIRYLEFPIDADSPSPGAQHKSIRHAMKAADADGTRSILDLEHISDEPEFGAVSPLPPDELMRLFNTERPTRGIIEENMGEVFEVIERGQGIYVITYKDEKPDGIFFAGYSCD